MRVVDKTDGNAGVGLRSWAGHDGNVRNRNLLRTGREKQRSRGGTRNDGKTDIYMYIYVPTLMV